MLFTNLTKRSIDNPSTPLNRPDQWLVDIMGRTSSGGQSITTEKALTISAMWACLRVLSESIASLSIDLMRRTKEGVEPDEDNPLYELLAHEPSPLYTSFSWREAMMLQGLTHGTCYTLIERDTFGRPIELVFLDNKNVKAFVEDRMIMYKIKGENRTISSADMIAIPFMSFNALAGHDMISACREVLAEAVSAMQFGNKYYANGAMLSGILSTDDEIAPDVKDALSKAWSENYSGAPNTGKTPILENGIKYSPISNSATDASLVEMRKFYNNEVARFFNIPPHMIQELERSTNNNIEQQSLDFVKYTLRPYIKRWEQELNRKLFPPSQRKTSFVRFNLESILRGDSKSRAELYKALFNMRAITPNEIRAKENMNPYEGGDGFYVQINMSENGKPIGAEQQD